MVPGASLGECCTAPVAIRMVKDHVVVKGKKNVYGDPVSAPPIGNTARFRVSDHKEH